MDGTIIHFLFLQREREKQGERVRKKTVLFDLKKEDAAFC